MFDDARLDETSLAEAERRIDDWRAGFEERAAKARTLSQRLGALSVTASSQDGAVTVTVSSSGALTDLRLQEKVKGLPAEQIAEQVLAVARTARAELARQVAAAVDGTVGSDSPTGRAILASYARQNPPPPAGKGGR